MQESNVIK